MIKQISPEGDCVVWNQCIPTKFHVQRKRSVLVVFQKDWIDCHAAFLSGGRVYADISDTLIMDAVTGSLYSALTGLCISTGDLSIDLKDKDYDKEKVFEFVKRCY